MSFTGTIMKAMSGFYYVKGEHGTVQCRARGIFRKEGVSPLVGDRVRVEMQGETGMVWEIMQRRNFLVRPPVANITRLCIVLAAAEPEPNLPVADRMIAAAELKQIEPVMVVGKCDIRDGEEIRKIYEKAGFAAFAVSARTGDGVQQLKSALCGQLCAFTGNTGVGKSSLLNRIDPRLGLKEGEISRKLGRGRHTTRHVELFEIPGGGYIADTPGFSSVDIEKFEPVLKERLQYAFREFAPYLGQCRFTGCSHTKEKGCAVLEAVERGAIPKSRHESYLMIYDEVKNIKEWELNK